MPSSLSLSLKHTHTHTQKHNSHFHNPSIIPFYFLSVTTAWIFEHKTQSKPHMFTAFKLLYILWLYFMPLYSLVIFFPLSKTADFWPLDSTGILSFPVFNMVWQALDYLYPPSLAFCPIPPLCSQTGLLCHFLSTSDTQSFGPLLWVISFAWNVHFQYIWLTKLLVFFSSMLKSHPPSDIYLDTLFNSASVHIHQIPIFPISLFCSLCFSILRITFDTFYNLFVHCPTPNHVPLSTEPMRNRMEAT